jgi:poly-gamma-glutamate capsule biosynthesis protein CapA/YwtB (metallophosphatase superfamily)
MIRLLALKLSRRRLAAAVAALFAAALSACSRTGSEADDQSDQQLEETPRLTATTTPEPQPSPTPDTQVLEIDPTPEPTATPPPPEPVRLWVAPDVEESASALAEQVTDTLTALLDELGLELEAATSPDNADVVISNVADAGEHALTVYGEPLVAITAPDELVANISHDQLAQLFDGAVANWLEIEGRDRPVTPVIHPAAELAGFFAERRVEHGNDIVELLSETPGIVAIIPRSESDFRVQTLIVDERDPLRDELHPGNWPYWEQVSVQMSGEFERKTGTRLTEALEDINEAAYRPRRTMMSAVGDIMLGRTVHTIMTQQNDVRAPHRLVVDELQRGDITIGNLECAITDSFSPPADPRTFSFMTFSNAVEGLQFAGFTALSGANNHAMDFGVVGMRDTTAALESGGIKHFGTGENLAEAREPCILEHDGVTFALLGYDAISMNYAGATETTGGVSPLIREYVVDDISRAREQADVVIPFFHWGVEYVLTPLEADRVTARAAIDAGAELVLGGHPHWVQGMEIYNGKPIFYSLSNFVFDQEWSLETKQGFVLHLVFDGSRFAGYRIVPVLIEDYHRPRIVEDDMRATILDRYWLSTTIVADHPLD